MVSGSCMHNIDIYVWFVLKLVILLTPVTLVCGVIVLKTPTVSTATSLRS